MTKRRYKTKCNALFKKAKKLGVELTFSPEYFNHRRLNCLWYGGEVATIKISDALSIELSIYGDVYAWLLDKNGDELARVKDKSNGGSFTDWMSQYIKTDKLLKKAIRDGRLILDYNNWIEYDGLLNNDVTQSGGKFIDLGIVCDNVLDDSILKATDEALDSVKEIESEIYEIAELHYGIKAGAA